MSEPQYGGKPQRIAPVKDWTLVADCYPADPCISYESQRSLSVMATGRHQARVAALAILHQEGLFARTLDIVGSEPIQ
jgi:hypothetical protein